MPLMLDVWREVGAHLRIEEAVRRITPLVGRKLPLEGMIIRRVHLGRLRAETVAECWVDQGRGGGAPSRRAAERSTALTAEALEDLSRWARSGEGVRLGGVPGVVVAGGRADRGGELVTGLLMADGQPQGVLVLVCSPGGLSPEQVEMAERLIEPLGVALANDRRLVEMERMREALEADRRALLSRLARQDVADAVVGADSGLREVMVQVEQVSATDAPVLLLGETGTGKEVVAREIHKRSPRASSPIERINCGAIPSGLVDSELFGHERGSFTGAVSSRKGWFERANGGTLFLDEIGELPLEAQVRLLRVLQDGTFERVGGQSTLRADVRVIAATHRDLGEMTAQGTFRDDLWFRLNVFPIEIPPLRERPEDIPALAAHFGWRAGRRLGRGPLSPAAEDLELLVAYPWPGNVRELAAVIERAAILGNGERLELAAALGRTYAGKTDRGRGRDRADLTPSPVATPSAPGGSRGTGPGIEPLDAAMAAHIRRALAACGGRIEGAGGAARLLDINPHTLRSRMRKLGVDWTRYRSAGG